MSKVRSYSAKLKEYLCRKTAYEVGLTRKKPDSSVKGRSEKCCAKAFFWGVALFSKRFDKETFTLSIENESLLEICTYILINTFHREPLVREVKKAGGNRYEISFDSDLSPEFIESILSGDSEYEKLFSCNKCRSYFLRGAFLSSGNVTDPERDYRVEFVLKTKGIADKLSLFLSSDFTARSSERKNNGIVYVKGRERVESFFTIIGAEIFTLDIIEKSIEKETMNAINRNCNCEHANTQKTVSASVAVRHAIERLKSSGKYSSLPDELKRTAELREKYPDKPLATLCLLYEGGISRSGLSHRMKKLIEISKE